MSAAAPVGTHSGIRAALEPELNLDLSAHVAVAAQLGGPQLVNMAAAAPQDPPTLELGAPIQPNARVIPAPAVPVPADATLVDGFQSAPEGPLYVVGDVHGYLQELLDGLHAQGLIDSEGRWSAGRSRLWFLGDFTDRGPDGIGVIETVMRLAAEAAAVGGYCRALMGNHELLLLGADRYGDEPVQSSAGTASFLAAWRLNGGQPTDMERLEDHHVAWLSRLPAMSVEDGHLLVHSDTTAYLEYGDSVDAVNDAVHEVLNHGDADEWWDCFRRLTKRFAFRGDNGAQSARELLDVYGGHRVVHGHSPIPYLLGDAPSEDGHSGIQVTGPHVYADELAVAMDGGVTMEGEGRLLIARLPLG
ncbi:metallophosphoesterase [Streptacidiphilus sp. NEAU-YB345]|uniref:Metallophosphoesterase n=2 Tax=Streptacidiphilus fuscans TaxID=2789292 RepID=A0A931B2K8_9ACTN|nr:metallophosphoesterase [Streptacidiphilus fuscans]